MSIHRKKKNKTVYIGISWNVKGAGRDENPEQEPRTCSNEGGILRSEITPRRRSSETPTTSKKEGLTPPRWNLLFMEDNQAKKKKTQCPMTG